MIQEIAKSRKLKKITMAASVAAMGIGLVTSLSSFEDLGAEGSGSGVGCYQSTILKCPATYIEKTYTISFNSSAELDIWIRGLGGNGAYGATGSGTTANFTGGGESKICDFTGTYGTPKECTNVSCDGNTFYRRCVLKTQ